MNSPVAKKLISVATGVISIVTGAKDVRRLAPDQSGDDVSNLHLDRTEAVEATRCGKPLSATLILGEVVTYLLPSSAWDG